MWMFTILEFADEQRKEMVDVMVKATDGFWLPLIAFQKE